MAFSAILILSSFLLLTLANAATFTVTNKCSYTVWAAAYPGGGMQLNTGQTWSLQVQAGTKLGRIWGRTGCNFDYNGNGNCQTGDCGKLVCTNIGSPPNTVAEFNLNQYKNIDFYYLSLLDGFNIPMDFLPVASECSSDGAHCRARVNAQCPSVLKTTGGCLNPCQVLKTDEYCCNNSSSCAPTKYSKYFKTKCPQAFTYPRDDESGTFICPGGTNYTVVFCP